MKPTNPYWLALVFSVVFCIPGRTAEKTSAATRAYQYQREARAVLTARGWHISRDETGKLVADHSLGLLGAPGGGTSAIGLTRTNTIPPEYGFSMYAWLTLTFRPESTSRTPCVAHIVAYSLDQVGKSGKRTLSGPTPYANPDTTKEIQDMLAKAESTLTTKHPEYAAK